MKKRHREVVNPFSIKTKKNRPDQSPVEHIKHASTQDETQRGRNRQPPIRSRDDAVGDGAACFRRTLDDRKQRLGDTHVASIERAEQKRRFTILAVKKNGGGSPRRGKGVNANPTPIPV
jgi:hypothetical protein